MSSSADSIMELTRGRLINAMIKVVNGQTPNLFVALVVDDITLKLVSTCLHSSDLVENRVAVVDKISKTREPLPTMEVIYFLTPTTQNVKLILQDFPDPTKFKPKYKRAHIFWSGHCPDDTMHLLSLRKDVVKRLGNFQELYLSFLPRNDKAFHIGEEAAIFFERGLKCDNNAIDAVSDRLVSFCATLQDMPLVRYQQNSLDGWCEKVAHKLHHSLADYWEKAPRYPNTAPCTLLLVDRSLDTAAMLMHDFHYEAMAYDLCAGDLNTKTGIMTQQTREKVVDPDADTFTYEVHLQNGDISSKTVKLDQHDELWWRLRHKSIIAARDSIMHEVKEMSQNSEIAQYLAKQKAGQEVKANAKLIMQLPAYQEKMAQYNAHTGMCMECFSKSQAESLNRLGGLEQDILCGVTSTGTKVDAKTVITRLAQILMNKQISVRTKTRLLLLYISNMEGVSHANLDKMIKTAQLDNFHKRVLQNYIAAGYAKGLAENNAGDVHAHRVTVEEQNYYRENSNAVEKLKKRNNLSQVQAFENDLCRAEPQIRFVLERMFNNKNANTPCVGHERSHGVSLGRKTGVRPRCIVYFIGGVTFSELRVIRDLEARYNVDLYFGGDCIMSPYHLFLDNNLNKTVNLYSSGNINDLRNTNEALNIKAKRKGQRSERP